ncbi:MAG: hypothetical protein KY476_00055 [Planctomycetes bacterium]|nr:hypothetical protein [Planctomycetota bacterium]
MKSQLVLAALVIVLAAGVAIIQPASAAPNAAAATCFERTLADADLVVLRGRSYGEWCWPHRFCDYGDGTCPDLAVYCDGKTEDDLCTSRSLPYFPEECTPDIGNETCSANPPTVSVYCRDDFDCLCQADADGVLQCSKLVPTGEICKTVQTEIYCIYDVCQLTPP